MSKKYITDREYQEILKKIQIINDEKAYLKNTYKQYLENSYKFSYDDIMNIILNLQRENSHLLENLQLERKKFLSNFLGIYLAKEKLDFLWDKWINYYTFSSRINDIVLSKQAEELFFCKDTNFIVFKENTIKIVSQWEANNQLLNYINSILIEEKTLLVQKRHYERKKRKKSFSMKYSNNS